MDERVKKRIDNILTEDTGIDPATIDPIEPIRDQIALDSMQFVSIIARIEIEFEIELPISIIQVNTLQEFYDEIQKMVLQKIE